MPSLLNDLEIISMREPKKNNNDVSFKPINELYNVIIDNVKILDLFELREKLYNLLLYQVDVYESFYSIIKRLYKENKIQYRDLVNINMNLIEFSKLYNNNYRPIFHLERFSLYLIKTVNEL
tara:strand:+ start:33 stop:398 length:366 start_codon:yes stop_codon:yes gene_type:complete